MSPWCHLSEKKALSLADMGEPESSSSPAPEWLICDCSLSRVVTLTHAVPLPWFWDGFSSCYRFLPPSANLDVQDQPRRTGPSIYWQ